MLGVAQPRALKVLAPEHHGVGAAPAGEEQQAQGETTTNMVRRYGWAPRGERCRVAVPHGHWKTTTVTAALRTSGVAATALFDGATNGQRFRAYVTDTLVPVLKQGDTVIMDNLGAHKVAGVREAIQAVGAKLLYLPPYSPDFNLIDPSTGSG